MYLDSKSQSTHLTLPVTTFLGKNKTDDIIFRMMIQ